MPPNRFTNMAPDCADIPRHRLSVDLIPASLIASRRIAPDALLHVGYRHNFDLAPGAKFSYRCCHYRSRFDRPPQVGAVHPSTKATT